MRILLLAICLLPSVCFGQAFSLDSAPFLLATSPLRRGLTAYWRLEEASGTRYDCSKNGNHLTSNNSVGQSAGKVGNCGSFTSASSQCLSIPSNATLQPTTNGFTICAWVKPTSITTFGMIVTKNANVEYELRRDTTTANLQFTFAGPTAGNVSISTTNNPLSNGSWTFCVAWYDPSGHTVNLQANNGTVFSAAFAGAPNTLTGVFNVGARTSSSNFWDGLIDEVGIWNRALTSAERTQLYNAGLGTHFPWAHP